ncbi:MAG TPA: hypothetical protein VGM32_16975 [Rhodopila sp.]|jgi:hypothetical protein
MLAHSSNALPAQIAEQPVRRSASALAATGARAVGAVAIGALALGAVAVAALAIGRLAIGRLALRSGHVERLTIGDLTVVRLRVIETVETPPPT